MLQHTYVFGAQFSFEFDFDDSVHSQQDASITFFLVQSKERCDDNARRGCVDRKKKKHVHIIIVLVLIAAGHWSFFSINWNVLRSSLGKYIR